MSMEPDPTKPSGPLTFLTWDKPSIQAGDYTLTVEQQVFINSLIVSTTKTGDLAPTGTVLSFSIRGPRFNLDPQLIRSVFPPDKSLGEFSTVLPHLILNRTTLPWERTVDGTQDQPWLALLLLDQSEGVEAKSITAGCLEKASGDPQWPGLTLEVAQHRDDRLAVIDVPKSLLWKCLPTKADLPLLAHLRRGKEVEEGVPLDDEETFTILVCNRLPAAGSESVVHLVSLEGRNHLLEELSSKTKPDDTRVRLISLTHWRFASVKDQPTFTDSLKQADSGPLRLPVAGVAHAAARQYLEQGYVALGHQTRQGNHLVSWYRGPFLPGESPTTAPDVPLPIRAADQIVRYHATVGMFDESYAAAWELGRLLTLQSRRVAVALFNWKRSHAQATRAGQPDATHLPYRPRVAPPELPQLVRDWFGELTCLEHVPFDYLVPHADMLPRESIRFFSVDPVWLECLLDGAFSIGRVLASDVERDTTTRPQVVPTPPRLSGFLLRSHVVQGWPHLEVEAYQDPIPNDEELHYITRKTALKPKEGLGMRRLAKDVLLCLFELDAGKSLTAVDLHEQPEAIHFGVDEGSQCAGVSCSSPDYLAGCCKTLRSLRDGEELATKVCLPVLRQLDTNRALDVLALAGEMKSQLGEGSDLNSAQFGLEMIAGVAKVRFLLTASGTGLGSVPASGFGAPRESLLGSLFRLLRAWWAD
jgi:hypothetical protein